MRIACHEQNDARPVVELENSTLRALCRPVRMLGIFAPARWREWRLTDLAGFWVGRPRIFPPDFWMFETNTSYLAPWLVLRPHTGPRFYVREFGRLNCIDEFISVLRHSGLRQFDDPRIA